MQSEGSSPLTIDHPPRDTGRNAVDFGIPLFMEPNTALLFARAMNRYLPKKEGIPGEVRRWSEFLGGKPL